MDEAVIDELIDKRRADAVDVHCVTGTEMQNSLLHLSGAGDVGAAGNGLAGRAFDVRAANGAFFRALRTRFDARALLFDDLDDLRYDLARALDDHRVANADALAADFILVV